MKIIERTQEKNGRWTIRIANAEETRSMFLSFLTKPTDAEVRAAFQEVLAAEQARRIEDYDEQAAKTELQDAIVKYEAGQLTNAQSKVLLDKIIARLRKGGLI